MTNIRKYAKQQGYKIVGKLHRVCDLDRNTRFYLDDANTEYLVDVINETVRIITKGNKTKQLGSGYPATERKDTRK